MRKILITGGAGFIGSCLAERLIEDEENFVVVVDDLSTGELRKLPGKDKKNWKFIKCDVNNYRDIAEVVFSYHFDYIFHYAAMVGVQRTQQHPVKVLQDLHGIENILNLSKNSGIKRIYYASSSEVYGEPVELPQNEHTTPLNSRIPYAVVKNVGESFLRSYHKEYGLEYTIFRFFNTYGPKQSKDFVISRFISLALTNQDITVYGDGTQTRTFCFIDDNVTACVNAFNNHMFMNDVINIGSDIEFTIEEVAALVIKLTKSKSKIIHLAPLEEGDMKRRMPDITKMRQLLQREPISLENGIQHILKNLQFIIR